MKRTNSQNARFHALLTQRKLDKEEKQALVLTYTHGRSDSSTEMTSQEMAEAIKHLEGEEMASIKKMRAKIINIAKEIFGVADMSQVEWDNLNKFLLSKSKGKLNELHYETLRKAVTSMQMWKKSADKKREGQSSKSVPAETTQNQRSGSTPKVKPTIGSRWLIMENEDTEEAFFGLHKEHTLKADYLARKIANSNPVDINDVHELRNAQAVLTYLSHLYNVQLSNRLN